MEEEWGANVGNDRAHTRESILALPILCRHAFENLGVPGTQLRLAPDGCRVTMPQGERLQHEPTCASRFVHCGLPTEEHAARKGCPVMVSRTRFPAVAFVWGGGCRVLPLVYGPEYVLAV